MEREQSEMYALFSRLIDIPRLKKKHQLRCYANGQKQRLCARMLERNCNTMVCALVWQAVDKKGQWHWEAGMTVFVDWHRGCVIPLMSFDEMYEDEGTEGSGLMSRLDLLLAVTALRKYKIV